MGNLFFSQAGRIDSKTFLQAGLALAVISTLLFWILVLQRSVGMLGLILFILSLYPWYCIWAKRLRNGDKSPGLMFAYLILFLVLAVIFILVSVMFFSGGEFMEAAMASAKGEITPAEYSARLEVIEENLDPRIMLRNMLSSFALASVLIVVIGDKATPKKIEADQ